MIEKKFRVIADQGLHAKPATSLIMATDRFVSDITLVYDEKKIDFKSIIGVLSLGIYKGEVITLIFNGKDEEEACNKISELIKKYEICEEI